MRRAVSAGRPVPTAATVPQQLLITCCSPCVCPAPQARPVPPDPPDPPAQRVPAAATVRGVGCKCLIVAQKAILPCCVPQGYLSATAPSTQSETAVACVWAAHLHHCLTGRSPKTDGVLWGLNLLAGRVKPVCLHALPPPRHCRRHWSHRPRRSQWWERDLGSA